LVFGRNAILLFVGAGLLGRSLRFYRVGETPLGTWIFEQVFLPISRRFGATNPAELFTITPFVVMNYLPTICPLFAQLTLPLHENRSVDADYTEETATEYRKHTYHFEAIFQAIKVILLEGIDLLQRQFCSYYHLAFWIECGFATALERAIARAQEGLPPEETVKACETIYFPAQEIHFERDQPQVAATATINNDPRLG
jgi:uridine kinase